MAQLPEDVCNLALDALGYPEPIGSLTEGTKAAQICLRRYSQAIKELARSAHWDAFRRQAPLELLADATGQTANAGTLVISPWQYEYAYPIDCLKARFVPRNVNPVIQTGIPPGNISIPSSPLPFPVMPVPRQIPAKFLVANDINYPVQGQLAEVQGISIAGRTVICTNVQNAQLVYTAYLPYPSLWDVLFRSALVAYLASEIALAVLDDKKFARELRDDQIKIARAKIEQARVLDGNEGSYSSDIQVDWMNSRNAGRGYNGFGGCEGGSFGYGWDSITFADGSAF